MTQDEQIEEIIRGQFVDKAYRRDGTTSWGVDETVAKIETLLDQARKEERAKKIVISRDDGVYCYMCKSKIGDHKVGGYKVTDFYLNELAEHDAKEKS